MPDHAVDVVEHGPAGAVSAGAHTFDTVQDAVRETGATASMIYVPAAGAADGPTLMGVGGRALSGTLDIRFAYVSTALAAALIFSVGIGRAFGPPPLSEKGSRYFLGRRW